MTVKQGGTTAGTVEPILERSYWRGRLQQAERDRQRHLAIFRCPLDQWQRIEEAHRAILARTIGREESILDAGCGWGRLLDLLPAEWRGRYLGVDLSPDFISLARRTYRQSAMLDFVAGDLRALCVPDGFFDWAVLISIRPMVRRNLGEEVWAAMEAEVRRAAKRLLYLEYDETDGGSVESGAQAS